MDSVLLNRSYRTITSKKSTDMRCLIFIISQLQDRRSQLERAAISSGKLGYFTFGFIRGSLRLSLLAISVAMHVAFALSYRSITCHIAYNSLLSHVCFFLHFGRSNIYICDFNKHMHLHQFNLECVPDISGLSDQI